MSLSGVESIQNQRNDDSFDVDIQPDVSALRMFRSMSFTPWYALGEFVDNSLTSAMKHRDELVALNGPDYKVRIKIDFPAGTNELIVSDNAAGISREEMQRALRVGKAPQDISVGLSRHGVGMKAAAFWWGSTLEIETYPLGHDHGWRTVLDVSDEREIAAHAQVTKIPWRGFPGTTIRIRNLWQKTPVKRTKGTIRAYLPSIYRAFLGGGTGSAEIGCILEYEGTQLAYETPPLLEAPYWPNTDGPDPESPSRLWRETFDITLRTGRRVSGWYGLLEKMSRDKSGFFLHYRGKGIAGVVPMGLETSGRGHEAEGAKDAIARASYKPRKIFGQQGNYRDQMFVGEFDVSDFGKTISTDAPLWSPDEHAEFVDALYAHMTRDERANFIRMADSYRRQKSNPNARESASERRLEASRIEAALNEKLEHRLADALPDTAYFPAPILPAETLEDTGSGSPPAFSIHDRDGHRHSFVIEFIADRSADFVGLYKGSSDTEHVVRVNRNHPVLDDVPPETRYDLLLQRLAVALAAAEVFLTMVNKSRVREMMNDVLREIGTPIINE